MENFLEYAVKVVALIFCICGLYYFANRYSKKKWLTAGLVCIVPSVALTAGETLFIEHFDPKLLKLLESLLQSFSAGFFVHMLTFQSGPKEDAKWRFKGRGYLYRLPKD